MADNQQLKHNEFSGIIDPSMNIQDLVNAQIQLVEQPNMVINVLNPQPAEQQAGQKGPVTDEGILRKVTVDKYYVIVPSDLDSRNGVPEDLPNNYVPDTNDYKSTQKYNIYTLKHFLKTYGNKKMEYSKNSNAIKGERRDIQEDYTKFIDAVKNNLKRTNPDQFNTKALYWSNMIIMLFKGFAPYIMPLLREENKSAIYTGINTSGNPKRNSANDNFKDLPYFNDTQLSSNNDEYYNISTFFGMLDMLRYEKAKINKYTFPSLNSSYVLQSQGNVPLGMILYATNIDDAQQKFEDVLKQQYILQNAENKKTDDAEEKVGEAKAQENVAQADAAAGAEKKDNLYWIGLTPVNKQYLPTKFTIDGEEITHLLAKWVPRNGVPRNDYFNKGIPGKWMVIWNTKDLEKIKNTLEAKINSNNMKTKVMIFANVQGSTTELTDLNNFILSLNNVFQDAIANIYMRKYSTIVDVPRKVLINNPTQFRNLYDKVEKSVTFSNKTNKQLYQQLFILGVLKHFIVWFPKETRYGEKTRPQMKYFTKQQPTYKSGWYFIDTFTKVDEPSDFNINEKDFLEKVQQYGIPPHFSAQLGNEPRNMQQIDDEANNKNKADAQGQMDEPPLDPRIDPLGALSELFWKPKAKVNQKQLLGPLKSLMQDVNATPVEKQNTLLATRLMRVYMTLGKIADLKKKDPQHRTQDEIDMVAAEDQIQQSFNALWADLMKLSYEDQVISLMLMPTKIQRMFMDSFKHSTQRQKNVEEVALRFYNDITQQAKMKNLLDKTFEMQLLMLLRYYRLLTNDTQLTMIQYLPIHLHEAVLYEFENPVFGAAAGGARKYPAKKYRFASRKHSKRCKTTSHKKACRRKSHRHRRITRKR